MHFIWGSEVTDSSISAHFKKVTLKQRKRQIALRLAGIEIWWFPGERVFFLSWT